MSRAAILTRDTVALPLGLAGSLGFHALLVATILLSIDPHRSPPQVLPPAEMSIEAWQVERSTAAEAQAQAEAAPGAAAEGVAVATGQVPQQRAQPRVATPQPAPAAPLPQQNATEAVPAGEALAAAPPAPAPATALPPPTETGRAAPLPQEAGAALAPEATPAAAAALPVAPALAAAPAPPPTAAVLPPATAAPPLAPEAAVTMAARPAESEALAATSPPATAQAAAPLPQQAGAAIPAEVQTAATLTPAAAPAPQPAAAPQPAPPTQAAALPAAPVSARGREADPAPAAPQATAVVSPQATTAPPAGLAALPAPAAPTGGEHAPAAPPPTAPAPRLQPEAEPGRATPAPLDPDGQLDPKSLAALAAFMQPGTAQGEELRDGLEGLLAAVPCARLQLQYDPGTGALTLRGHIPDEGLRAPLLAALGATVGAGMPVQADLRLHPSPQCGALAGIAALGLPQSQEQARDTRLLGPDAFAREFDYAAGEPLSLDLQGADYPAWLYVDYFDAAGEVIHLIPNSEIPLQLVAPAQPLDALRAQGGRGPLGITFGPPFGQEIAVAFAASHPLYEGLRPLTEPAEGYLAFLRERIAATRAAQQDFKGEWVYFFISTHP